MQIEYKIGKIDFVSSGDFPSNKFEQWLARQCFQKFEIINIQRYSHTSFTDMFIVFYKYQPHYSIGGN